MFVIIAPRVKVFISDAQLSFVREHQHDSFKASQLSPEQAETAKVLADKAILVRKKLDNDVQYALNKRIRFVRNGFKK